MSRHQFSRSEIAISDPWELVTNLGDHPLEASIEMMTEDCAVLCLEKPVQIGGKKLTHVLARPRHVGDRFFSAGTLVPANFSFQSKPTASDCSAESLQSEESIVAIGTLRIVAP